MICVACEDTGWVCEAHRTALGMGRTPAAAARPGTLAPAAMLPRKPTHRDRQRDFGSASAY